ncbi:MAG: hypothetical protein ACKOX6_18430 [Bdellovibrio sp.]
MLINSRNSILMSLCLCGLLSACEVKKNLDDMHDATVKMSNTTEDMSDTTKRMEEKTGELDKKSGDLDSKTAELYDALRQGNAAILRKEFLTQMTDSKEMAKKLSLGVKYFWAFEFQLWSMQGLDDAPRREELATSGAREFIREVQEYASVNDFISPTTTNNKEKNFLALATTLHEVNDKQKNRVDPKGIEHMSMLTLIERALNEKRSLEAGKISLSQLSGSSYELLNFEDRLIQLLQARHNFILAMIVARTSKVDQSLQTKVKLGLLGMKWSLDLSKFSDVEIAELKKYAKGVLDTRLIIAKAGHNIEADETIMKILRNSNISVSTGKRTLERTSTEQELLTSLKILKNSQVDLK